MKVLIKYWYIILLSAVLSFGAALITLYMRKAEWVPDEVVESPAKKEASDFASMSEDYVNWNYEIRQIEDLQVKMQSERELIEKEKLELSALRQQVNSELSEMLEMREEINALRDSVDAEFYAVKESEGGNLKRLAKVYSAMKPPAVVGLFSSMEMELVVKIMSVIPEEAAADILAEMTQPNQGPELMNLAITITEKLRQIRK